MRTSSRLGLSATKSMCLVLGLGLGVSALDRILKRPNLNKRSNRKGRIRPNKIS